MGSLNIQEAAKEAGASKVDVWLAIQAGALLAQRTDDGGLAIDPAELFRVFEPQRPEERPLGQDGTAFREASDRPEITPEANATPETNAATNDMAASGAARNGPVELPVAVSANDKPPPNGEERQAAASAQQPAPIPELAAERAKVDMAIAKHAAPEKRATPWWRRLAGWVHIRRGRAAKQRLRERL